MSVQSRKFKDASDYTLAKHEFLEKYQEISHLILTAAEFTAINHYEPPEELQHPGNIPAAAPAGASADARSIASELLKRYQFSLDNFKHQETLKHAAKTELLTISPSTIRQLLSDPEHGTMHLHVRTIFAATEQKYRIITGDTLIMAKSMLPKSCTRDPESIRLAACEHRSYYSLRMKANQPTAEHDKFNQFLELLSNVDFGLFKQLFKRSHPTLAEQTFELLVSEAITEAETMPSTPNFTANSATLRSYDDYIANAVRAAAAAGFVPHAINAGPATGQGTVMHYCWSHGPNTSHNSQDCRHRHDRHKATATAADKQGGRTVVWTQHSKLGP